MATAAKSRKGTATKPQAGQTAKLLSGGNPQIAKGHGDEVVQAYIQAVPDWKRKITRWVDAAVTRAVPGVRKAVKYNSPLYGAAGREDWFLSLHCFTDYVKVAFFHGTSLKPQPPGESKQKRVRYLDLRDGAHPDEKQFAAWCKQAAKLPGEKL